MFSAGSRSWLWSAGALLCSACGSPEAEKVEPGTAGSSHGGSTGGTPERPLVGRRVFDRDVLHEVAITVAEADLPSIDERSDVRVPASLVFDGVELLQVGVRNKGATSFQPTSQKPSFSIKLNEFVKGQALDGLKKLVLNNTVQDPTWANEILTYDTYRRAGLPAPRVAHAVLSLNGEPKGIYTIVEAINSQFLASYYGTGNDQGNLYEGPWDFTKPVADADLKDELSEMRTRDDLQKLTDIVLSSTDAGYPERLAQVLDVDQFMKGYAVDVATVAWDGYAYDAWNYYLYDNPADGRFVFLPAGANWPYFRDEPTAAVSVHPLELPQLWGTTDPVGFLAEQRVLELAAMKARFEQYLAEVTETALDVPALNAEFDRLRLVLHSSKLTDAATLGDLQRFDDNVDDAYDFVKNRKQYLLTKVR
jgi:spore coat protein H